MTIVIVHALEILHPDSLSKRPVSDRSSLGRNHPVCLEPNSAEVPFSWHEFVREVGPVSDSESQEVGFESLRDAKHQKHETNMRPKMEKSIETKKSGCLFFSRVTVSKNSPFLSMAEAGQSRQAGLADSPSQCQQVHLGITEYCGIQVLSW